MYVILYNCMYVIVSFGEGLRVGEREREGLWIVQRGPGDLRLLLPHTRQGDHATDIAVRSSV